ncbi:phage adaptor protein [[Eubacterium] cellulosolvens]
MPTAMTFDSLQTDLRQYLERGTAVDTTVYEQLPRIINLAERDIARALKIQGFINVVTSAMAAGVSVYAKPDRWRDTISINYGAGASNNQRTPVYPRSYEYLRMYHPDSTVQAPPEFYADYNYANWLFAPTPDAAYPFEVVYYELPALLDASNQTNWLTDHAPNTLLHGSLLQASRFLKNDERIPTWQSTYDRDLSLLNGEDLQKIIDRTSSRQGA